MRNNNMYNQMQMNQNLMNFFFMQYYRNMMNFNNNGNFNNNKPINNQMYNPISMMNQMNKYMNFPLNSNMNTPFNYQMNNPMNIPFNYQINNSMNMNIPFNNQMNNSMNMNMLFNNHMNNSMNIPFNNQNTNSMPNYQNIQNLNNLNQNYNMGNEANLLFNKIQEIILSIDFSNLKTEEEILNIFSNIEEKCLDFINNTFNNNNYTLKKYMEFIIENYFKYHNSISDKTAEIYFKLGDIYVERLRTQEEYFQILKEIFGDAKIPNFITLRDIPRISLGLSQGGDTINLIRSINNMNYNEESKQLLNIFTNILRKKYEPFILVKKIKYDLLMLFIILNKDVFNKFYNNQLFWEFLKFNENDIKKYFDSNFNYQEVYEDLNRMTNNQLLSKKIYLFDEIEKEINNTKNIIYNIIASFYYLLIYVFKDNGRPNNQNNLGNVYINLLLKTFVIFLDEKYANIMGNINLFNLLIDLYSLDIDYLKKKFEYPTLNYYIRFKYIEEILNGDELARNNYIKIKKKIGKDDYINKIRLINMNSNINSNTITILIDGFRTEGQDESIQWEGFLNYFENQTLFYSYKWPSFDVLGWKFQKAQRRAEICGEILANIIITKQFKDYQINLVGFSLGNHVIKHCLQTLYEIYQNSEGAKFANLKNIMFIAGATEIENTDNWRNCFKKLIGGRIINIYSKEDSVIFWSNFFRILKKSIGNRPLKIIDNENPTKELVENYEFQYGHLDCDYTEIISKIFNNYRDIRNI